MSVILDSELFSLRFKALFTYAQRLLRPIWDMKLTSGRERAATLGSRVVYSNVAVLEPALAKLVNLLAMIESFQAMFTRQTTALDQSKLLGHDIHTLRPEQQGIQNAEIRRRVVFTEQLGSHFREKMEVSQKKVLKNVMVFIRRCIDVIEFLKFVSFDKFDSKTSRHELF